MWASHSMKLPGVYIYIYTKIKKPKTRCVRVNNTSSYFSSHRLIITNFCYLHNFFIAYIQIANKVPS